MCATTAQLDTYSDDDDAQVPFGYEQLPQDGDEDVSSDDNDLPNSQTDTNMMDCALDAPETPSNAAPFELRVDPNDNIPQRKPIRPPWHTFHLCTMPLMVRASRHFNFFLRKCAATSDLIMGIMKNITLPDHAIPGRGGSSHKGTSIDIG